MKMNIKVEIKMKRILLGKLTRWEREEGKKMTTIEWREEINLEEDKELVVGKSKKWDLLKTTCLIT